MMTRLVPFALILIAIGVFFGYVKPTWQGEIRTLEDDIATFDRTLAAAESFTTTLNELKAKKAAIPQADLDRLQAFLPSGVDNIQLILDLTELAERTDLDIEAFDTPEPPAEAEATDTDLGTGAAYESLEMTVAAKGTYENFRDFADAIERSLRPLDIVGVTIGRSDTGVYDYQITLRFYWLAS